MTLPQHTVTAGDLIAGNINANLNRLDVDELFDIIETGLTDDIAITRELAGNVINGFQEEASTRTRDLARAVEQNTAEGRGINIGMLYLYEVVRSDPDAFIQPGQELAQAVADGSLRSYDILQLSILDAIVSESPGGIKPSVPPLVELLLGDNEDRTEHAGWILVRAASAEPEVIRPFIAERIWELDSANPSAVLDSLNALGAVGWVLPEQIPLDRFNTHIDTPTIRAAKLKALGKILAQPPANGDPFGRSALSHVDQFLDEIMDGVTAHPLEVQKAAVQTCKWIASLRPDLIEPHTETLVAALTACSDSNVYQDLLEVFLTLPEVPSSVYQHVATVIAEPDSAKISFDDGLPLELRAELLHHGAQSESVSAGLAVFRDVCFHKLGDSDQFTDVPLDESDVQYIQQLAAVAAIDQSGSVWQSELVHEISSPDTQADLTPGTARLATELSLRAPQQYPEVTDLVDAFIDRFNHSAFSTEAVCQNLTYIAEEIESPHRTEIHQQIAAALIDGPFQSPDRHFVADTLAATAETQPAVIADAIRHLRTVFALDAGVRNQEPLKELDEETVASSTEALTRLCTGAGDAVAPISEYVGDIVAMDTRGSDAALESIVEIGSETDAASPELADELYHHLDQADHDTEFRLAIAIVLHQTEMPSDPIILLRLIQGILYENVELELLTRLDASDDVLISILSPFIHNNIVSSHEQIAADLASKVPQKTSLLQRELEKQALRPRSQLAPDDAMHALESFASERPGYIRANILSSKTLIAGGVTDPIDATLDLLQHTRTGPTELIAEWTRHPDPDIRRKAVDTLRSRRNQNQDFHGEPEADQNARELYVEFRRYFRSEPVESLTSILTDYVERERVSRASGIEILLTELAYPHTEEEYAELAESIIELSDRPSELPPENQADISIEATPPAGPSKAVAQCLCDPNQSVRSKATAVLGSAPAIDTAEMAPVVDQLLDRDEPLFTGRLLLACPANGIRVSPERVAKKIEQAIGEHSTIVYAGAIVLNELSAVEPSALAEQQETLYTLLTSDDFFIQHEAVDALADLALTGVNLDNRFVDALVSVLTEYSAHGGEIGLFFSTLDTEVLASHRKVIPELLEWLSAQSSDSVGLSEVGNTLERLAAEDPSLVIESFDGELATAISDGEVDTVGAEYYLYRILTRLCTHDSAAFDGFAEPIESTLERTGSYKSLFENTSERGSLTVFEPALREAAATAAATAGADVFLDALSEFSVNSRPTHSAPTIATFLLEASPAGRNEAITWLEANAPRELRRDVVRETADRIGDQPEAGDHRTFLEVAEQLLTGESEPLAGRRGLTVVLAALDSSLAEIRQSATDVAHELMIRGPLTAEEWLSHVLALLGDEDPGVRQVAANALPRVLQESTVPAEDGFEMCAADVTNESVSVHRRQGAATALTELGTRVPACRSEAAAICADLLRSDDRLLRRQALDALATFADLSPAVVEPYLDRVRENTAGGSPTDVELSRQVIANYHS